MSQDDLFNDTLDNFTFSDIQQSLPAASKSTGKMGETHNVTLDDSAFLNTTIPIDISQDDDLLNTFHNASLKQKETPNIQERQSLSNNSLATTQEKCLISMWGLPASIQAQYESKGVKSMFRWQAECLSNEKVLEKNGNLIYSAPTSAGKTLVAEIIAIKTVLERKKKVLFVLPFVSVVREKMFYFQRLLAGAGTRVEGFMGSYNPPGGFPMVQVAICTIEKANAIINRCLEEGTLDSIGAVVIDEMHLLGDPSRGYLLELTLTKLRYMCKKHEDLSIQIIGMSATLPNLDFLARWLDADLYMTSFRPIPLVEQYLVNGEIYSNTFQLQRKLVSNPDLEQDSDNVLQLCLETITIHCSVLIFCPTKNWCENLAQQVACAFWKLLQKSGKSSECLRKELKSEDISEVLEQLKRSPVGLDAVLHKTISFGVAFHHAGLTMDERDIIEGGFRSGAIRVLVATSTLSSGVNLPARRVLVRTPLFHGKPIDILTYRQMIGRAGRMGKDTAGESILICQKNDGRIVQELMNSQLEPIESCLEGSGRLKRAILEVIASGVVQTPEDVQLFTQCTLLAQDDGKDKGSQLVSPVEEAVDFLKRNEFIRLQKIQDPECEAEGEAFKYVATSLAKACLSSSLPPEEGLMLFAELQKARQCFVLENELHLIYLVTPYSCVYQWMDLDWFHFLDMWEKLPGGMKKVGHLVGIQEAFIFNATRSRAGHGNAANKHQHQTKLQIHKRFYTALALQELVNEVPLSAVAQKFNCNRGTLQTLQQSASTFAGMITTFARQLGWTNVELLFAQFQDRLQFGVSRDLLDLMKLSLLDGPRARILYSAGIKSLADLAASDVCTLENIFYKALPFETEREKEGETEREARKRKQVRTFWITGKEGLTEREAAELLVRESRKYLTLELGLAEAKWNSIDSSSSTLKNNSSCSQEINDGEHRNSSRPNSLNPKNVSKSEPSLSLPTPNSSRPFETSTPQETQGEKIHGQTSCSSSVRRNLRNDKAMTCSPIQQVSTQDNDIVKTLKAHLEKEPTVLDEERSVVIMSDSSSSLFNESLGSLNTSTQISDKFQDLAIGDLTAEIKTEEEFENDDAIFTSNKDIIKLKAETTDDDTFDSFALESEFDKPIKLESKLEFSDDSLFERAFCTQIDNDDLANGKNEGESPEQNSESSFCLKYSSDSCEDCEINGDNSKASSADMFIDVGDSSLKDESGDLIMSSQEHTTCVTPLRNVTVCTVNNNVVVKKKQKEAKKRARATETSFDSGTPAKKVKIDNVKRKKGKKSASKSPAEDEEDDNIPSNFIEIDLHLGVSFSNMTVINVCDSTNTFETFRKTILELGEFSMAVACNRYEDVSSKSKIGPRAKKDRETRGSSVPFVDGDSQLVGVAFSWGEHEMYYLPLDVRNDVEEKVLFLKTLLDNKNITVRMYDCKEHVLKLKKCLGIHPECNVNDPTVADWMLNPDSLEKSLKTMVQHYVPKATVLFDNLGNHRRMGSIALDVYHHKDASTRSTHEAALAWFLMDKLKLLLDITDPMLMNTYETEMRTVLCLVNLEYNGIGVDAKLMEEMIVKLRKVSDGLEKAAHLAVGRRFRLNSARDIIKLLKLKGGNKAELENCENKAGQMIVHWRKVQSILSRMLLPIVKSIKSDRVHGHCLTRNVTGRISMQEPNLQNTPRDFEVSSAKNIVAAFAASGTIRIREAFVPAPGKVFVSADYCQLELRVLTHFCKDAGLLTVMNAYERDVFRDIAAKWNKCKIDKVNDMMRQRTKQLCYGIIYGMSTATLATHLGVILEGASNFINVFNQTFPGIGAFVKRTVDDCRRNGYVTTLAGRRRYLPTINDAKIGVRNQAERQAVNTTIQGSAADIAKRAMVEVEEKFRKMFPAETRPKLVLHMHDELMYEVNQNDAKLAARIIQKSMECVNFQLAVPLPVKIKCGSSWGSMKEI